MLAGWLTELGFGIHKIDMFRLDFWSQDTILDSSNQNPRKPRFQLKPTGDQISNFYPTEYWSIAQAVPEIASLVSNVLDREHC